MMRVWILSEVMHGATYDIEGVYETADAAKDAAESALGLAKDQWHQRAHGDFSQGPGGQWSIAAWPVETR